MFASAQSHKTMLAQRAEALLAKHLFPTRICGGTTPDLQGCGYAKNQHFREMGRANQEGHDSNNHGKGWS